MKLLADENTHRIVVERLRDAGWSVEWVKDTMAGALDPDILARSDIHSCILITNDRDFGDLIYNHGKPVPFATLYTRLPHRSAHDTVSRLLAELEAGVTAGHMTTITRDGVRTKPFPPGV